MQSIVIGYLIIINTLTFIVFGRDKRLASRRKWRISEHQLYILASMGGVVGALIAMQLFRHKTIKPSFVVRFAIITLVWIVICVCIINYG